MKKLVIGWFSFTCSEDNSILFLELMNDKFFEWKEKIEFRHFKMLKSKNTINDLDIAFIEGAISTYKDVEKLKEIRKNAKRLVAVGACAINATPSAHRNKFDEVTLEEIRPILERFEYLPTVEPLNKFVKVDDEVPGCPMDEKLFLSKLEGYIKEFGV